MKRLKVGLVGLVRGEEELKHYIEVIGQVLPLMMYSKMDLIRKEHITMHYCIQRVILLLEISYQHLVIKKLPQNLQEKMVMCMRSEREIILI